MKAEPQEAEGFLSSVVAEATARMAARAPERSEWERLAARAQPAPSFTGALTSGPVAVIAEVKRRSPSKGAIKEDANAIELARRYAEAGASAISVLTEKEHFGGSLEDLMQVARSVRVPVLRKDFIVDAIQVYEAKAAGAAAILLIVRALNDELLATLSALARQIGLETLVEVHSTSELARAVSVQPSAIGINARDLESLAMDAALVPVLLPAVPKGIIAVAESGIATRADVERVAAAGADAILVGTAVAGASDPGAVLRSLTGVARSGR
jgi:indole-3-glycerol phosphate synthase